MSIQPLSYQALAPQPHFEFDIRPTQPFMALQPRACSALVDLLQANVGQALVLKCEGMAVYGELIAQFVREQGQMNVRSALYYHHAELFGRVHSADGQLHCEPGLLQHADGDVLLLGVEPLLAHPQWWFTLKNALQTRSLAWAVPDKVNLPAPKPAAVAFKLVLLGSREQLAALAQLDDALYELAQYSEIEHYFDTRTPANLALWAGLVQGIAHEAKAHFDESGLRALYQLGARESEDGQLQPIALAKLQSQIHAMTALCQDGVIDQSAVWHYADRIRFQQAALADLSLREYVNQQIFIETTGARVGQVNGLSVVEYAGTPISFGEPSRITCTVQLGEGEITDVERKNDLAGNVHGKGTMLAQYCLAHLLNLPAQLPFSAAIVFEQSYSDIDGDSASLAQFCALVSALAGVAVAQHIAITGAIDQSGQVHSVGGVNQKIEGFFALCQQRGLTGEQGVIIPKITLSQLSLRPEVIAAVQAGQFHLWCVENVEQALAILTHTPLFSDDLALESLSDLISARLENKTQSAVGHFYSVITRGLVKFKK
ncbi:AAA family ATPase [Pasteurellaceae bacterium TAE3-ERU1]|nr:AAA family ATPase [Pasteurellaceae bacterium TAE3-ERU1]